MDKIARNELVRRYCETQDATPEEIAQRIAGIAETYRPDGFMLLRCVDMSSSRFGSQVILPFGGGATFKEIPNRPVSPRGLASDMSEVVAISD